MTYEEWSVYLEEFPDDDYGNSFIEPQMYADWTTDRKALIAEKAQAEADRDKLSIHLKDANYNLDTVNRLSNENLQRAVKAEAERDKIQKEWDEWVEKNAEWIGERSVVYAERDHLRNLVAQIEAQRNHVTIERDILASREGDAEVAMAAQIVFRKDAETERDKLAERVRMLEETLDAALLYRLAHETGAKIGAQDKTKADADIDKALIARAALRQEEENR